MKQKILILSAAVFSLAVIFSACQKQVSAVDNTTEVSNQADDQTQFTSETDAVANDIDATLESTPYFANRGDQVQSLICDATVVVDTASNPRTVTITYNGLNCSGTRTRTGVVILSMPAGIHWRNAGAALTVTIQNLVITRLSDNKSITINGTHTITNVSGGLLVNLPNLGTITHTITSPGMTVTFDNGTQRSWQVAKQRVFTYNNGVVITTTGLHSEGGVTGIVEWGTNRVGHAFTSSILEPMVVRQDCSFRIVSGKVKHVTTAVSGTATFGLDVNGNPTTCPGAGHYYMKVEWVGPNGNSHTVILPY